MNVFINYNLLYKMPLKTILTTDKWGLVAPVLASCYVYPLYSSADDTQGGAAKGAADLFWELPVRL